MAYLFVFMTVMLHMVIICCFKRRKEEERYYDWNDHKNQWHCE